MQLAFNCFSNWTRIWIKCAFYFGTSSLVCYNVFYFLCAYPEWPGVGVGGVQILASVQEDVSFQRVLSLPLVYLLPREIPKHLGQGLGYLIFQTALESSVAFTLNQYQEQTRDHCYDLHFLWYFSTVGKCTRQWWSILWGLPWVPHLGYCLAIVFCLLLTSLIRVTERWEGSRTTWNAFFLQNRQREWSLWI